IRWYNRRWYDYTGTTWEQMQRLGWKAVLHPDHEKRVVKRLQHSWDTGELWEDTFPLRSAQGEYRWFLSRAVPIRNENGEIVRWFGTNTDITDMRSAQEEIQKRRAEVEAILSSLPDGYIIYDQYGKIVQMNERAKQVIGFTGRDKTLSYEQRMMNLRIVDAAGNPFPLSQIPSWKALHGETTRDVVMKIERPDRHYWISVSSSPITAEGRTLGAIMEFSDITRMHTLQEQLTSERNFVNAILQTSGALILVTDESGDIVRLNKACEHLSGYSEGELMNHSFYDLLIMEKERPAIQEALRKLREGERVVEHENHWVTKSGEKKFIRWRNTLLADERTQNRYVVATGIDISDRRLLEQELNRRAEELAAANRELESFSFSVSHDLRSPLHTIASFSSILKQDYAGSLDKDAREYLQFINDGIRKMDRLISDLLALSRISRQEMERSNVDLSALVAAFLQELYQTSPQRSVEFDIADKVRAFGDERLLDVALKNLLRNAWKFTGKNELTRIAFGTYDRDGTTVYFVRDNGVGFDNKFAQKIFEPFKRTHSEKDFGGTGVGLSIVERVVTRHGGRIWAQGEVGKGAGFYFTLQ
ncbi:MAG: PAS domain-containing sensor histidine kinase, partial [Chitinivibrionales bacterium]